MTIDEKLQHFYDVSIEEAKEDAAKEIQEHREALSQMLNEHKDARRQGAEAEIKAEADHVRREINKALAAEQITLKRHWSRKQEELKDNLFSAVRKKVDAFMQSPEYLDYLCKQIRNVQEFAGTDPVHISISSGDSDKLDILTAKTGAELTLSKDDFIGGVRAAIPEKNIMIDNSFLEELESMRKEFKFDGGLNHE